MLEYIKEFYRNPDEDKINFPIINRDYEKNLEDHVVDCFKSITSVLPEIVMTDHRFIIDVDKVDQTNYERTRSNKQKDQKQKYIYMNDSRLGELIMNFDAHWQFGEESGVRKYTVKMLIPIPDENNYCFIKGKKYILQYQITESSTYTTSNALVGKSLLPIKIRRNNCSYLDSNDIEWALHAYEILVFNKYENFLYFYFATKGFDDTLEYFEVGDFISIMEVGDGDPRYTYFKINNQLVLKVLTKALKRSEYVQCMVGSILNIMSNRTKLSEVYTVNYWLCKIGAFKQNVAKESQEELGHRHIILFNRMLDEGTKNSVKLTDRNRKDIYAIVRWLIQNYRPLWQKDNLDLTNKRLRCNEYVASQLNIIISEKIKRFVNSGANKVDKLFTKYDNFFRWRGNEIISKLHSSGLLRYDDTINDLDFFKRLKVTLKGPNSAGNRSDSKTITAARRALHPSHLLRLDLNVCSASDPGLTNYLSPFCETEGLYFKGSAPEPESFSIQLKNEIYDTEDGECLPVIIANPVLYNNILDELDDISIKGVKSSIIITEKRKPGDNTPSEDSNETSEEMDD